MKSSCAALCVALLFCASACSSAMYGQEPGPEMKVPKVVPVPPLPARPTARRDAPIPEPTSPPARTVVDSRAHVSFHLPAGWVLARKDGEISTFHQDARTAPPNAQLRAVANLDFNPYPLSTFAGALFYVSTTPHSTEADCAAQTTVKPQKPLTPMSVANLKFNRGLDEHGHICTEARVLTYTAMHEHSCLRFDLAVNTFCGGDDSGAQDMTDVQLAAIFKRMLGILDSVTFTTPVASAR